MGLGSHPVVNLDPPHDTFTHTHTGMFFYVFAVLFTNLYADLCTLYVIFVSIFSA